MFHVKHKNKNIYKILFNLALKSAKKGDVPVSSIILYNNKIIGKGYNNRQNKSNVLGHAEINAIKNASKKIKDWRLNDCVLITTLQPCKMCAEVIESSRIDEVYYLISQDESNYIYKYKQITEKDYYIDKYKNLFTDFFKNLR